MKKHKRWDKKLITWSGFIASICTILSFGFVLFNKPDDKIVIKECKNNGNNIYFSGSNNGVINIMDPMSDLKFYQSHYSNSETINTLEQKNQNVSTLDSDLITNYWKLCRDLWSKKEFEQALSLSLESNDKDLITKCKEFVNIPSHFDNVKDALTSNNFEDAINYVNSNNFKGIYDLLKETNLSSISFQYEDQIIGIFKKDNYYLYWGEGKNEIPHGHGYWLYKPNGNLNIFETDWTSGIPNGKCIFTKYVKQEVNSIFTGNIINGLWHGTIQVNDYAHCELSSESELKYNLEYINGKVQYYEEEYNEFTNKICYIIAYCGYDLITTDDIECIEGVSGFTF